MSTQFTASVQEVSHVDTERAIPDPVRDSIRQSLEGLRFGQITINIHEGEVVQIDRIAKLRQFRAARART